MKESTRRTNKHHRRALAKTGGEKFNGQIEGVNNVILVDWKKHQAFHQLFPDTDPAVIARELNEIWIDPSSQLLCVSPALAREIVAKYKL